MEWITVIALILGPLLAIALQLGFEKRREERKRRMQVLDTLMSFRGRIFHSDCVQAVNRIDLVFYHNSEVRQKYAVFYAHLDSDSMKSEEPSPEAVSKADDLAAELISEMAKDLGYSFDHTVIKRRAYHPRWFNREIQFLMKSRAALVPLLEGKSSIRVKIDNSN